MQRQQIALGASAREGVNPGIAPHVGPIAPEAAELDVVAVRALAEFEHEDKLMSGTVQRTHPAIILDPDAEIFQLAIDIAGGRQQLGNVAPIHAEIMQGSI